ncbi:CPBP family intramembrane glutamic endopeptidase [Paenibacillus amylolyticus]|uniref:CPBP family intramembrane glutamic endopeptidase n=1 Tax=Paenibacillus amylolyticus TaxID=1451 RepID=UPI0032429601
MRKIIQFPLVWMLAGVFILVVFGSMFSRIFIGSDGFISIVLALAGGVLSIAIYWLIMRFLAGQRNVEEIHRKRAGTETIFGAFVGLIFIGVSVGVIVLLGGYTFTWSTEHSITPIFALAISAAIVEELVFRGLFLQAMERLIGSWIALAVTSLFFGLAHLANPGATIWSSIAIFIEAGVLLGAGFLWRRNLWFVMGLHFAWNAFEGMLGIPVSGMALDGLFEVQMTGSTLLTGGSFGLEASIVPMIVSLLIAIPMLINAYRNGNIISKKRKSSNSLHPLQ